MDHHHYPAVIGFCGLSGSGKSFAARHLTSRHAYRRTRFAEPLKAMLLAFGCSPAEVDGPLKGEPSETLCGKTPRQVMQWLGTEWGRDLVGGDLWLNAWRRRVAEIRSIAPEARIVVDDVRFLNEAHAIWELGGKVVRIDRISAQGLPRDPHISEIIPFGCDARIINSGDAQEFAAALDVFLAE